MDHSRWRRARNARHHPKRQPMSQHTGCREVALTLTQSFDEMQLRLLVCILYTFVRTILQRARHIQRRRARRPKRLHAKLTFESTEVVYVVARSWCDFGERSVIPRRRLAILLGLHKHQNACHNMYKMPTEK